MEIRLRSMQRIRNFSPVRAVVEVECGGLVLRGLKLEERDGRLVLAPAGRKVGGEWQLVYEVLDPELYARLQDLVEGEYLRRQARRERRRRAA